uniref:FMRFamide-like neuropeptide LPEQDFMRF-amide n=1 Tax=Delia radicum TaxID=30064 RepID=FAR9_DELRA|nr:RecName: Full=FMRFamide-like neuropeptide LPEQDFMRF-amide [Delia radicum]
LPEQDFMRF